MKRFEFLNHIFLIVVYCNIILLSQYSYAQTTGKIILEKTIPSTAVVVTATQEVVLKPGFHAIGDATSSFNARIGTSNSLSPVIQVAIGSTVTVPTSPSTSKNYIQTKIYLTATPDESSTAVLNSIQYFDGLGRPAQTIAAGITPSGADLVSRVGYDGAGRQNITYLPVAVGGNFGLYTDDSSIGSATSALYGSNNRPYVETLLEASPLNRVTGQKKPGADWESHPNSVSYEVNGGAIFYFTVSGNTLTKETSNYNANTLYKTATADEDGKEAVEYKDKLGHIVAKKAGSASDDTETFTYYVYNDLDQLAYVLPPAFIAGVGNPTDPIADSNELLKQFAYVYRYDERGNCIYKKLPGCTPIYMVYDKADRLVLSQDGNQRKKLSNGNAQWTASKYDALGRVTFTGLVYRSETDSTANYKTIQDIFSNIVVNDSYTGFSADSPLTLNYYDDYSFLSSDSNLNYDATQEQNGYTAQWTNATALLTGTRTYFLDGSGSNTTAMYYDDHGRVVQSRSTNHLGGYNLAYNQYNFTGKVLKTLKKHKISTSDEVIELYTYTYDNGQRLKTTTYSLNSATAVTLVSNSYDELGRLITKNRHNNKELGLCEYNIRNWPTKITSGTFEENLYYNSNLPSGATANYNGNIAYSTWTYNGVNKGYSYVYDGLNRLTSANFKQGSSSQSNDSFNESFAFDKMGNILAMQRKSNNILVDDLTLHYANGEKSNQIDWITDARSTQGLNDTKEYQDISKATSGEFAYDANGNMIKDLDRDIYTIKYNVLNLPDAIQFKNGNQIINSYDASGHKLGTEYFTWRPGANAPVVNAGDILNVSYSQATTDQNGTAYIGNIEYNTLNGNTSLTTLSRIYNDEGYVENPANPQYYYFRHDHLGDNREVWLANTGETVQRTQYYPSGLPWAYNPTVDHPDLQHRRYNGKEFVEMHGYDTYDYGARGMYPAIGRFATVDPLAEKRYSISPYAYCSGNPVNRIDPDGMLDGDPQKAEFKIPNLSEIVHGVLAAFGCDPQMPKTDSKQSLEESKNKVDQQTETRTEVKEASKEALVMGAHKAADGLEMTGTVMQGAGYALAIPTEGVSLSLIPAGKKIEAGGMLINTALDLSEGKTGKAAANLASSYLFGKATSKVTSLGNAGKLAKNESTLLQFIIDVHSKITNLFTNFISDKK